LVNVCTPKICTKLLHENNRLAMEIDQISAKNKTNISKLGQYNESLKITLQSELDALRDMLWATYGKKSNSISVHPEFSTKFVETIWKSCSRDVCLAPTWFRILFYGSLSNKDSHFLEKVGNNDLIDELGQARNASSTMLTNKRTDISNNRQAAVL
jgi:hypothetical protein